MRDRIIQALRAGSKVEVRADGQLWRVLSVDRTTVDGFKCVAVDDPMTFATLTFPGEPE